MDKHTVGEMPGIPKIVAAGLILVGILASFLVGIIDPVRAFSWVDTEVSEAVPFVIEYDEASLRQQIGNVSARVYGRPVCTDFSPAQTLGFSDKDGESDGLGRVYEKDGATLEMDKYGCFVYTPAPGGARGAYALSETESYEKAKEILNALGLWEAALDRWSVRVRKEADKDGMIEATGAEVVFKKTFRDGLPGEYPAVTVTLNRDGALEKLEWNIAEYTRDASVTLIPVEDAIRAAREGKLVAAEPRDERWTSVSRFRVRKISVGYWAAKNEKEEWILQPVYRLEGTAACDGYADFTMILTVQANPV